MNRSHALLPFAAAAALVAFLPRVASAVDGAEEAMTLLIDDRGTLAPAGAGGSTGPVDVGQNLPADLPPKHAVPTGPLAEEIRGLIKQLGADDFRARDAASKRLQEIGADALGPLAEARRNPDPEIASRAGGLVRQITHRPSLFGRTGRTRNGNALGQRVRVSAGPNGVQTEVFEGERRIEIVEGPAGIEVSVSGIDEGRPLTERAAARTIEELRAKNPDAAALYDRWGANGRGGGVIRLNNGVLRLNGGAGGGAGPVIIRGGGGGGGNLQINVGGVVGVDAADRGPADDLARLRLDTMKRMLDARTPADRRAEVLLCFEQLIALQSPIPDDPAVRAQRMRAYNEKCDELRKRMADLKLPDPGAALPPPPQARLGITIDEGPDGVTVGTVLDGSRGARVGLRPRDVIRKVNDKPVATAADLRARVTESDKLVVEVTRDGKVARLTEAKPAAADVPPAATRPAPAPAR